MKMGMEMKMNGCTCFSFSVLLFIFTFLLLEKVLAAKAAFNSKCQNFTGGLGRH
jgi:hypothetical protein